MGNYRFRLADMMPNAWFYKLRDMGRTRKKKPQKIAAIAKKKRNNATFHNSSSSYSSSPSTTATTTTMTTTTVSSKPHHHPFSPRKSYYFTRDLPDEQPPRKSASAKPRPTRRRRRSSAAKPSSEFSPESSPENASCESDVVIDVDKASLKPDDDFAKPELAPIITKPGPDSKRAGVHSPGIRLRISHSPRIVPKKAAATTTRKAAAGARRSRSLSDSFAVVKSSANPRKDFKDSMMEMIEEHHIRASKDLEDLLACYLSLNSDEYHGTIIKVFKQIWFDLADLP